MIAPSISFDDKATKPLWSDLTLEDVRALIRNDVAELNHYLDLQAQDAALCADGNRQPNYRLRTYIKAWEYAQDAHWSWYRKIRDARTTAAQGAQGLG
ncbi:Uncharacterised protein [Mycobacteroides abscessus]|nr:hypothetical protein PROPHIT492_28 [Mycobacterium phage prophiT49-2]CPT90375.1 Uncharacterised protein [Mycobacteroides abscessus]SHT11452.1 Uncharacterised protein [Mycobacteroides abscessus subsp. abscessus]SLH92340.1 Uncharacterised protein [Mycobacteroides abscessus subsp. massiliense]CPW85215.1 Uncharacterised protein [Mycobacteroides abscessus]